MTRRRQTALRACRRPEGQGRRRGEHGREFSSALLNPAVLAIVRGKAMSRQWMRRAAGFLVAATLGPGIAAGQPAAPAATPAVTPAAPSKPKQLAIANKPWTGDFDKLLERRMIRVYSPFSRSLYFNDQGRERGLAVELVRDWERYLNLKYAKQLGKRPLTIYIAPATRDKLAAGPHRRAGRRRHRQPHGHRGATENGRLRPGDDGRRTISEVVVTGPKSPAAQDPRRPLGQDASTCARPRATTRASRS